MLIASLPPIRQQVADTIVAKIDSVRVPVASDSLHPHIVRLLQEPKGQLERILTDPAFTIVWPIFLGIVTFALGRWWQSRERGKEKRDEQWTSARLTRRYLLSGAQQLRTLIARVQNPQALLAPANVELVRRVLGDFEEIKTRMIALENDVLEERIFQWNATTLDNLKELVDRLTMDQMEYSQTYGVTTVMGARDAALVAKMEQDAIDAESIVRALAPYIALKQHAGGPAAASGEEPKES